MPISFEDLPGEVRNQIYRLALLQDDPIDPFRMDEMPSCQLPTIELFQASRMIHSEASSIFYSHNRFDFSNASAAKISWFLTQIGNDNARYIRHICVSFPVFTRRNDKVVSIREASVHGLAKLRRRCPNMSTLTVPLEVMRHMNSYLFSVSSAAAIDAIHQANVEFRSFMSTIEISAEFPSFGRVSLIPQLREMMEAHGWNVIEVAPPRDAHIRLSRIYGLIPEDDNDDTVTSSDEFERSDDDEDYSGPSADDTSDSSEGESG